MFNHYIRLDENGNIVKGFSSAFEEPLATDICITENAERQFELLGMINPDIVDNASIFKYKYINGEIVEKNSAEKEQELTAIPAEPDVDDELATAIASATSLEELKSALLGKKGLAKVKGKPIA